MPRPPVVSDRAVRYVTKLSELNRSYMILMAMSGILAAVALLTNSIPVLIGAMVIAPALPPLALIAFGAVNRKPGLAMQGIVSALVGLGIAVLASLATTWILNVTRVIPVETNLLSKELLDERVTVGWYSAIAAVAAGISGIIALTERKTDTLVGVVAALALVPAGSAAAIAFLSKDPIRGWGGLSLLGLNVALIIASGIITLLLIRPRRS
ncbi:MAG: DUF389 domain-containing protein [Phormidesmis sp.]